MYSFFIFRKIFFIKPLDIFFKPFSKPFLPVHFGSHLEENYNNSYFKKFFLC